MLIEDFKFNFIETKTERNPRVKIEMDHLILPHKEKTFDFQGVRTSGGILEKVEKCWNFSLYRL